MKIITKYILASFLITILTITLFGLYSLKQYHDNEARNEQERLEKCIRTFWKLLSYKGTGFKIVDGKLLVGDYPVNGNFELPDTVQEIFGGVATIFMGDERVSTNVLTAEGKRAVGTRLVGPAYDAVFKQGGNYRGNTTILGVPYLTAYDPIRDSQGKTIGVLFVGVKESDFLARLHVMKNHQTLTLLGLMTAFTILMVLLGRETGKYEQRNEEHLRFLQTLIDTIPSPVYYKNADGCYLGCNKAFEFGVGRSREDLIGKTAREIWPVDQADQFQLQDQALFERPGVQIYEESVRNADGIWHQVVFNKATFHNEDGSLQGLVGIMLDITERKRAEEALEFQNILLSAQQEASIDGILVVDENAKIISFNRRFVEIMEIPAQLLETREDQPVLQYVTDKMVDPESFLAKVKQLYQNPLEISRDEISLRDGKTLDRYTVPLLGSDGRYYGRLWSFRDITERKAAEEKAKNAYQQLMDIVEFLPDATFVVDKDKRVIAWNRAIENMTGLIKEAVMGNGNHIYSLPFYGEPRPILIDLIDEDLEVIARNYTAIKREGRTIFAETHVPSFRNGGSRYFWGTATPLFDKQGNQVGGIESIRDITEYRHAEHEKSRLEAQLHHARMMESFLVRLGHDLKTPLTPLVVLLPLIRERVADPELKKMLDLCCKNTNSIKELTDKTRLLVSLSTDIKPYELEHIQLSLAVEECLEVFAGILADKNIHCQNGIDPAITVQAVPAQINELFANLIANAAHYSAENGVVCVAAKQCSETVTVTVSDDGIGLEPDHLELVFDEFFKVDESRHDLEASGLGLSICKRIVQNHHGRIWVESAGLGQGTSVVFTLGKLFEGFMQSEEGEAVNG